MNGFRTREKKSYRRDWGLTGNTLKVIAMVTMVIDHIGAGIIENGFLHALDMDAFAAVIQTEQGHRLWILNKILRMTGRISFPIFCFLLVEGFVHTGNVKKYASRLLLFALISEVPFNLAFFGSAFYIGHQNVFFTLFIGILVLTGLQKFYDSLPRQMLVVLAGCAAAYGIRCDYQAEGILLVSLMYLFRSDKSTMLISGAVFSALESISCMGTAALAYIPVSMYNGKRGQMNLKYIFYWFYPLHLLLFYGIQMLTARG